MLRESQRFSGYNFRFVPNDIYMEDKQAFLDELDVFEKEAQSWINNELEQLGWAEDHVLKLDDLVCCPFDAGHRMPRSSLEKHVELCKWKQKGFTKEDMEKVPSSEFFYSNSTTVVPIHIDEKIQAAILARNAGFAASSGIQGREVPLTGDHGICEFTVQERLAIYEYVVDKAKAANQQTSIPTDELLPLTDERDSKKDKGKSFFQQAAEERDMKRRRKTYRAKNVHITKKSHTEVIREVINSQMKIWERLVRGYSSDEETDSPFEQNIKTEHDRSSQARNTGISNTREYERCRTRSRSSSRSRNRRRSRTRDYERSRSRGRYRSRSRSRERHRRSKERRGERSRSRERKQKHKAKHKQKHKKKKKNKSRKKEDHTKIESDSSEEGELKVKIEPESDMST